METAQLLGGVLDLAVLAVVASEDGYGSGALTSYVVASEEGAHRAHYGITTAGRAELKRQAWMVAQDIRGPHVVVDGLWPAVLAVFLIVSVQLGRRAWGFGRLLAASALARLVLVGLNVFAVTMVPGAVDRATWQIAEERGGSSMTASSTRTSTRTRSRIRTARRASSRSAPPTAT